jgi:pimeloyl-ACP methyl ester carboxylesterase
MTGVVIYLHGFASSPASSKATYIAERLRAKGIRVEVPDLNRPDFSTLTVTRMIEQASHLMNGAGEPVMLIGSSLGGFVAINLAAARPREVTHLVLLAPAVDFAPPDGERGPMTSEWNIDEWRRTGRLTVFHYGYGRLMTVGYDLYADARRYDALSAQLPMPSVVFQGTLDDTVDPARVETWSRSRPNVELHLVEDDHQLSASLPAIWTRVDELAGS